MKVGNGAAVATKVGVVALRVEDLDRAFLADAVADFSGVDPDGQVGGEVLDNVGDGVARLPSRPVQDRVGGVRDLQAPVGRPLRKKTGPLFCAHFFLSKKEQVDLFSSSLPRFDKCHETSRIFPRTE